MDDEHEDIDDFEVRGKQPLLSASDNSQQEANTLTAEELKQKQRWLFSKSRKKGVCPICNEEVRSGAHACAQTQRKLQIALQAEIRRNEGNAHYRKGDYHAAVAAYTVAL